MSVNINELKGTKLKKEIGLRRVIKRWHNHNNTGGNFGINLYVSEPLDYSSKAFEITGEHDTSGIVRRLRFGALYQGGGERVFDNTLFMDWDYVRLVDFLKTRIEEENNRSVKK